GLIHREADMSAGVLASTPSAARDSVLLSLAKSTGSRIRLFGPDGSLRKDSWKTTGPTYPPRHPTTQKWNKDAARVLDRGFNALVGAKPLDDFVEPADDRLKAWSEGLHARAT